MKILKRISALLLALLMILPFAACDNGTGTNESTTGEPETESTTSYIRETKTKIAALNGTTGLGVAKIKMSRAYAYEVTYCNSPEEITALITEGKTDLATLPITYACELYKSTEGKIKILAVNGLGILHVIENGKSITDISSLSGKTVYASGKGTATEYILNYVFSENGVNANIKYVDDQNELYSLAAEGKANICILPEPLASTAVMNNGDLRYALNISEEWSKISETPLAQSVIVARSEYIDQNPEYIEKFLSHNETSVNYLKLNLGAGTENMLVNEGHFDNHTLANFVVTGSNLYFMKGEEMKAALENVIGILFEANPDFVGGEIPDGGIYYIG